VFAEDQIREEHARESHQDQGDSSTIPSHQDQGDSSTIPHWPQVQAQIRSRQKAAIEILYLSFSARASTHNALLEPSRAHTYVLSA
jgi:hypothetical protein